MIKIAQISDLHLLKNSEEKLFGTLPNKNFITALSFLKKYHADIDYLHCLGDIAQDEREGVYQFFCDSITQYQFSNISIIPGNHDDERLLFQALKRNQITHERAVDLDSWKFIFLNSKNGSEIPGMLSKDELDFLNQSLENSVKLKQKNIFIALHHEPILFQEEFDKYALTNRDDFWRVLDQYQQCNIMISFGHMHQESVMKRGNVHLLGCPATSAQLFLHHDKVIVSTIQPQVRIIQLFPDGEFTTKTYSAVI